MVHLGLVKWNISFYVMRPYKEFLYFIIFLKKKSKLCSKESLYLIISLKKRVSYTVKSFYTLIFFKEEE